MAKSKPFSVPGTRVCLLLVIFLGARQAAADFIDIQFSGGVSAQDQAVFAEAEAFWESHLTGFATPGDNHRLVIDAGYMDEVDSDGPGGILGFAGPQTVQRIGSFTYATSGLMRFDASDMESMRADGSLLNVIQHEMGHVLGIGTLWEDNNVYVAGTGRYTGQYALAAWREEFGQTDATFVPVELGGGGGTANGHWDEWDLGIFGGGGVDTGFVSNITNRDFRYELMTGWLDAPTYLSTVTLGTLRDMGYIVGIEYTDIYTGPAGGSVVVPHDGTLNVRILEGGAGTNTLAAPTTAIQSLTLSAQITSATLDMGGSRVLVVGSAAKTGAIEINLGARDLTVGLAANDGFVTAGSSGAATLNLVNGQVSSVLTLNSAIRNNAGGGAVSLSVSGADGAKIILRGDNTHTGTTTVHSATLVFDAASSALTGALTVEAAGVLAVGNDSGGIASRVLSFASAVNSGTIDIRSDGMLDLTGATALTGTGTLANHGVLGVAGTVTTTNALAANAGSVLLLADGGALLNVGSLTIAPGAKIAAASINDFTPGTLNQVVHATGSLTGSFTVDTALSADPGADNLRWISRTLGQDVFLGLQYYLVLPAGLTPQQRATAGGLGDATLAHGNAELEAEYARLTQLSDSALSGALDRLSGHDRAAVDAVAQSHAMARGQNILQFAQMQLVNDETVVSRATDRAMRATALGDLQYGEFDETYGLQFFVHAGHVTESRDGQRTGVLAADATGDIFTVGVHNQLTDNINVGLAFTYDQTKISSGNGLGEAEATTYSLDLYFSNFFEESQRWFIAGVVGAGKTSYDNSRSGITPGNLTATGSASGTQFHIAGQLGYRAQMWQDAILTPYAGLSMARNTVDAYAESLPGAPGLALAYEGHTSTATEAVFGLDFAQSIRLAGGYRVTPSVGVAWHHQLGNTDSNTVSTHFSGASGTTFNTYLGTLPDDAVEIQGAISVQIPGGLKVFIDGRHYESMGSSNGASQDRIGGGLRYDF